MHRLQPKRESYIINEHGRYLTLDIESLQFADLSTLRRVKNQICMKLYVKLLRLRTCEVCQIASHFCGEGENDIKKIYI